MDETKDENLDRLQEIETDDTELLTDLTSEFPDHKDSFMRLARACKMVEIKEEDEQDVAQHEADRYVTATFKLYPEIEGTRGHLLFFYSENIDVEGIVSGPQYLALEDQTRLWSFELEDNVVTNPQWNKDATTKVQKELLLETIPPDTFLIALTTIVKDRVVADSGHYSDLDVGICNDRLIEAVREVVAAVEARPDVGAKRKSVEVDVNAAAAAKVPEVVSPTKKYRESADAQ